MASFNARVDGHFRTGLLLIAGAVTVSLFGNSPARGQWPQWGGQNRDFKAAGTSLAPKWPENGPRQLWSAELGPGLASVIADSDIAYAMYREDDWEESLAAVEVATGERGLTLVFPNPVSDRYDRTFGIAPRTTPLIVGNHIYAIGFAGKMCCAEWTTKKYLWSRQILLDFNGTFLKYGYSSSPIGYKDLAIVQVGGKRVGFIAFDGPKNKAVWVSPPFVNTYSSPIIIDVDGEDQLIAAAADRVVAVDPRDGEQKWAFPHEEHTGPYVITPVWGPDNLLFIPSGGGAKSRMLKLSQKGKKTVVEEVWASKDLRFVGGNVIRVGDYLYGSGESGGRSGILAVKASTGEIAWHEGGFSSASIIYADGKLIIRDSDGYLALATATPKKLTVHSKAKLLGKSGCPAPALAGTTLYVPDGEVMRAFDLQ